MIQKIRRLIAWCVSLFVMVITLGLVRGNTSGKLSSLEGRDTSRTERRLDP